MRQVHIEVCENSIQIDHLEVPVKEVADFFRSMPSAEHDFMLVKAIEVGVFCLERGRTGQDTDFVKRKMTELLSQVEQAVVDIPARTEKNLLRQIGADDGQVLSPVKKLVNEASSETARRINDLKALLSEDLDPKSSKSVLGAALQTLRDFLNPDIGVGSLFEGKVIYDKTYGHVAYGCAVCCGYTGQVLTFNPLGIPFGTARKTACKPRIRVGATLWM